MLTKQSWRRAIVALTATGITVGGSLGPAYGDPADRGTQQPPAAAESGAPAQPDQPAQPTEQRDEPTRSNPPRHTPVEVCHLRGDGSYKLVTMDDSALSAHQKHGDLYPVPADGCPVTDEDTAVDDETGEPHATPHATPDATPKKRGHTPVTVCHLRGNGSYHELTFDDDAFEAHLAHGDLHPVPADGCATDGADAGPGGAQQPGSTGDAGTTGTESAAGAVATTEAVVLGSQKTATRSTAPAGQVAGRSASAGDTAAVSPVADVLPQTGAGRIGVLLAAAAALLAAGTTLLARRRSHAAR